VSDRHPARSLPPEELRARAADALTEIISNDVLDLTDLAPPEPLERLLRAASQLAPGASLLALLPRDPVPAKAQLLARGLSFEVVVFADGRALLRVRR